MNKTIIAGLCMAILFATTSTLEVRAQDAMTDSTMTDDVMIPSLVSIGGLFPISGSLASTGINMEAGAQKGVDDFNVYLNEIGAGWQIEWIMEDTETKPVVSLEKIQSLNSKGINLIVGPATSGSATQILGYVNSNDMVIISPSSTSPSLAIPDDNLFRLVPNDKNQGIALASLMATEGIEVMVPIWRGDAYGDGLKKAAEDTLMDIVSEGVVHSGVRYDPNALEFSLEIDLLNKYVESNIEKYGADKVAVMIIAFGEVEPILESAARYDALKSVRWFSSESSAESSALVKNTITSEFIKTVDLTAVQFLVSPGVRSQALQEYVTETLGETATSFTYPSYDAVWVLGKSILEAGSTDTKAVKAALPNVAASYSGAMSSTNLNSDGDLDLTNYQIWQIRDNSWSKTGVFVLERGGVIWTSLEQPEGEVQVGSLYPLTGRQDSTGYDTRDATQLGADHFNQFLKSINIHDWHMRIVSEDSATSAPVALEKATTLNARGIDIIIGPRISSNVEHVKTYADINDMMIISCCSTAPRLATADDSVFRMVPDDTKQSVALTKLFEDEGIEVVIPIWRGDTYGDGLQDATKKNVEAQGYTFDEGVRYNPELLEFGVSVDALNSIVADAIAEHGEDKVAVFLTAFDESISLLQGAATPGRDALQDVRWFTAETLTKKTNILNDPIASNFVMGAQLTGVQVAESDNKIHDMVEAYFVEKNGETPITLVYHAYDAAWLVGLSMLQTGATDAPTIRDAFPDVASRYMGAIGDNTLNDAGDLAATDYAVWRVIDGEWVQTGTYIAAEKSILPVNSES